MKISRIGGLVILAVAAAACSRGTAWQVGTLAETRHVLRSELPPGRRAVGLRAARNEAVSFQILVRAEAPLRAVRVEAGELTGPGGASSARIAVRLYRQHQVHIAKGTDRNAGFRPDWYPDPLIPFLPEPRAASPGRARFTAQPFDLPAGETHGFWADLFVPGEAAAGEYRGTFRVSGEGARTAEIPVSLTVWDFSLPSTPTLATEFGSPAEPERQAGPDGGAEFDEACHRLLSEHHLNAVPPAALLTPEALADGSFAIPADRLSALREFADLYHVNAFRIPHPGTVVRDPKGEAGRLRAWLAAFDRAARELDRPGIMFYTYLKDEPNTPEDYRYVQTWGRAVREAKSVVKVLVVEQPWTAPGLWHADSAWGELAGAVDIWCPLFSLHRPDRAAARQALGEAIWTYTALCQERPTPWWHIDFPLLNYRVPAWMAWADGMTGLLYWGGLSYWKETDDPWIAVPIYSEGRAARNNPAAPVFNGEGSLVYPGGPAGIEGVVPTIRLKALRDGIEDYEYLALAGRLGRAEEANRIVRDVAPSFFEWTGDPAAYEAARDRLADLILKASGRKP